MAQSMSERIYEIVTPCLNSDNRISLSSMENVLVEAGLTNEVHGCDSILQLIEYLGEEYFTIEKDSEDIVVFFKKHNIVETSKLQEESSIQEEMLLETPSDAPHASKSQQNKLYFKFCSILKKVLRENPNENMLVSFSDLGQELKKQEFVIPDNQKLSEYIRQYPQYLEITKLENGGDYVRPLFKIAGVSDKFIQQSNAAINKGQNVVDSVDTALSQTKKTRYLSLYKLFDFFYTENYKSMYESLISIADLDDYFILPDERESDPYYLIDLALKVNFAKSVRMQINNEGNDIVIGINSAEFNTGFKTNEGKHIYAKLTLNQERDINHIQNYVFKEFVIKL